jgi:SAM-dependent methyltransferase
MNSVGSRLTRSGLGRVVCFNWPKYATAAFGLILFVAVAVGTKGQFTWLAAVLGGILLYGIVASIAATWWVYDGSPMSNWQWVADELAGTSAWTLVHAGFDESGGKLAALLGPPIAEFDIGPPVGSEERSLRRARHLLGTNGQHLANGTVPLPTASVEAVVCLFAVHEVRNIEIEAKLFAEFVRCLTPSGKLLVVEHARDLANFVVFGPAIMHFGSPRRWHRSILASGLRIAADRRQAVLVHTLVGQR